MALNHEHDFIDAEDEVEARREARRIALIGGFVAVVLGFGLVSLLLYGKILMDEAVVATPPAAITAPIAPTTSPTAPSPNAS